MEYMEIPRSKIDEVLEKLGPPGAFYNRNLFDLFVEARLSAKARYLYMALIAAERLVPGYEPRKYKDETEVRIAEAGLSFVDLSIEDIAKRIQSSVPSTRRTLRELTTAGWIIPVRMGGCSSIYIIGYRATIPLGGSR